MKSVEANAVDTVPSLDWTACSNPEAEYGQEADRLVEAECQQQVVDNTQRWGPLEEHRKAWKQQHAFDSGQL